jgi:hypothetical protein
MGRLVLLLDELGALPPATREVLGQYLTKNARPIVGSFYALLAMIVLSMVIQAPLEGHANTDVTMRMQAFFPGIELFGVFLDTTSFIRYTVEVDVYNVFTRFETTGTLTSSGFVSSGEDIGAVFNASHHTVTVAPFFLNVDLDNVPPGPFRAGDDFSVTVTKTLEYHGANSVEIASGDIIDPNHISAPIRNGLIFTEVTGVPEPGSFLAVAAALALILRRARLKA